MAVNMNILMGRADFDRQGKQWKCLCRYILDSLRPKPLTRSSELISHRPKRRAKRSPTPSLVLMMCQFRGSYMVSFTRQLLRLDRSMDGWMDVDVDVDALLWQKERGPLARTCLSSATNQLS